MLHIVCTVAFFITLCYHTIYASPWIFPPLALYGLDMLLRLFRYRIKDATLEVVDNQMTIIRVLDCDDGWVAGQHIRVRIFFGARVFESHPLSIMSAPPASSCLSSPALMLGARVNGDWTRALNAYARAEKDAECCEKESDEIRGTQVQVMLDVPYGGCSVDLGRYESALLIAGGSGATFTLGVLDDIVARCAKLRRMGGERTKRIEFAWCTKSFASIDWFAPLLMDIATTAAESSLELHISIFVTCLCDPEAIPPIPNMDVTIMRPSITQMLMELLVPPGRPSSDVEDNASKQSPNTTGSMRSFVPLAGGVGVCASGPETLTREAQNAVARVNFSRGVELGGIALHTELFAL